MDDSSNLLGADVWRRGALLGLRWVGIFFIVTLGVYGILGRLGWIGITRALCAMSVGPVFGTMVIVAWEIRRRPSVALAAAQHDQINTEDE